MVTYGTQRKATMLFHTLEGGKHSVREVDASFERSYDVIVAGLGTAGAIAALTSASNGVKTLGIDRLSGMGGLGTYGVVWDYFFGSSGGFYEAVDECARGLLRRGYSPAEPLDGRYGSRCITGCVKEAALERFADKTGLDTRYETSVIGIFSDNSDEKSNEKADGIKISGLRVIRRGRISDFGAKYVIDCTGNSLVCRLLGLDCSYGRGSDGQALTYSKAVGSLELDCAHGVWNMNSDRDYPASELSHEILRATSKSPSLREKYTRETRMIYDSTILGRREGKSVSTLQRLTFEDYAENRMTPYPLFYVFTPLDNTNQDVKNESEVNRDWAMIAGMRSFGFTAAVPREIFIPADAKRRAVDGLLIAGKGMGIDHDLAAGFRMKKDFQKCGEAVGTMAAMAIKYGCSAEKIDIRELRRRLSESGCLCEANNVGIGGISFNDCKVTPVRLPYPDEFPDCFRRKREDPRRATALWSARIHSGDKTYIRKAVELLGSEDPDVRISAALAAGLMKLSSAVPVLADYLAAHDSSDPDYPAVSDLLSRFNCAEK